MGDYIIRLPGKTVALTLKLIDNTTPANNPIIGYDCEVSIRRLSDDKWWDFSNSEWDTVAFGALTADQKQALTDKGDGSYEYDWNQATADASAEREYEMHYKVTSAGAFQNTVGKDHWIFTTELPAGVWDYDLASKEATAKTGTDAGELLVASRAGIAGRLSISGTIVTLYEVDGYT